MSKPGERGAMPRDVFPAPPVAATPSGPLPASPPQFDAHPRSYPAIDDRYSQALEFLYGRINYEKIGHPPYTPGNYRLDRMRQLLLHLGNPHLDYPIVHIAGTKGKGTTATLLADCLQAAGRRVGLYTSPHLERLEERIRFRGAPCSRAELCELTERVQAAAVALEAGGKGRATFFELTTAMGLLYFSQQAADAVVLEVGMGGRLDSTNVCAPVLSLITSVSLDHQAQLGNTLDKIAMEKAGIIKLNTPVICTCRAIEARQVVEQVAAERHAPLSLIGRDFTADWAASGAPRGGVGCQAEVTYRSLGSRTSELDATRWPTPLLGQHQADNIAGVVAALEQLRRLGWNLRISELQHAIARSHPPARLEIVGANPLRIIDTAHNPDSIRAGINALRTHFADRPPCIVFASSRDKEYGGMLRELLPHCRRLIVTAYQKNPRCLPAEDLHAFAKRLLKAEEIHSKEGTAELYLAETPAAAWQLARQLCTADDLLYATGSFFLAAELLELGVREVKSP